MRKLMGTSAYSPEEVNRLCLNALRCPDSLVVKSWLKENKDKLLTECVDWVLEAEQYKGWRYGEKYASFGSRVVPAKEKP